MTKPSNILALSLLLSGTACPDTDAKTSDGAKTSPSDAELSADSKARLRECGVLGAGTYDDGPVQDAFDRCVMQCTIDADCADLKPALCSDEEPTSSAFASCAEACLGSTLADQFKCDDGTRIPHAFVCDLEVDCTGGEDEGTHCGHHRCTDGETISIKDTHCDGYADCGDGSDEDGCAVFCE